MEQVWEWLLAGDVSLQYMTHRFLLGSGEATLTELQRRIPEEGYGAAFLSQRNASGHWGLHYYQPKWTSTHYTLTDLKNLFVPDTCKPCRDMILWMFNECMLADGGFSWDAGAKTGDPHTTICVLEGLGQYRTAVAHDGSDIVSVESKAIDFLLTRRLYMDSDDKRFLKLSYPYRYRYDLLRVLEYFATYAVPFDGRMLPALRWLQDKRHSDGLWHLENRHKGNLHFDMEETGKPSRFMTIKALFVLQHYGGFIH